MKMNHHTVQRILLGCLSGGLAVSLSAQTDMEPYIDDDVYILSPF